MIKIVKLIKSEGLNLFFFFAAGLASEKNETVVAPDALINLIDPRKESAPARRFPCPSPPRSTTALKLNSAA